MAASPEDDPIRSRTRERASDLAAEFRDAGWDALALQPANTVPVPVGPAESADSERDPDADVGLSFLLPESEFDLLAELATGDASVETHRDSGGGYLAIIVVVREADLGASLVLPLTFHAGNAGAMRAAAHERDELDLLVRPANTDRRVELPLSPTAVFGAVDGE